MNNEQFRRLVFDSPSATSSVGKEGGSVRPPRHQKNEDLAIGGASRTAALGSRMRSSIPMTPYVGLFQIRECAQLAYFYILTNPFLVGQ
jgi:hypothetical protein